MAPIDHKSLPALLRFVFIESLPFYIFYAGFTDVVTTLWSFFYLWNMDPQTTLKPGDLNYKVINAMWTAIFIPGSFTSEIVVLSSNHLFWLNAGCLLICFAGIGYQAWVTLVEGGRDACSGRYLAAKWLAEESPVYKAIATIMGIYTLIGILVGMSSWGMLDLEERSKQSMMMDFLFYKSTSVVALVVNAFALGTSRVPEFDYSAEEFEEIRFHRSWMDLMLQPSSLFMTKLQSAILHAKAGMKKPLEKLLESKTDVDKVLYLCTFDGEHEGEDESDSDVNDVENLKSHVQELLTEN